jgi:UDP-N-acetylmuramoyl-L-alanyl-D-glutamate--2,6-diaminopimelate ligase
MDDAMTTPLMLRDVLASLPMPFTLSGDDTTLVTAPVVESDAEVLPGGVFVARRGLSSDGHRFIPNALARGAAAIVGDRPLDELADMKIHVPYVQVADAQQAVGWLASAWHGHPSQKLTVVGVTGTDGKTTTSTLLHSILQAHTGGTAGLISTIQADVGDAALDTGLHVTTPGAPAVHALLARMVANGLTHVVLEMTSHGLAQGRLNGVAIDVAVLTNLTHEHLDFHGTFEAYREAKGRMFGMLSAAPRKPGQPKTAVINGDDPNADFFAAYPADARLLYGLGDGRDVRAHDVRHLPGETRFTLSVPGQPLAEFSTPLVGRFNVLNVLAAVGAGHALGVSLEAAQRGVSAVTGISGRMQRIDEGQAFIALVDFAHTPHALANALSAARDLAGADGRVIAVFGSAGLRDREKRVLMAENGARMADISILTAEDPRTESLDDILNTMVNGAVAAGGVPGESVLVQPDRGAALALACEVARPGDVVIACGKGHEQSMCFGTVEYPWDDREALRAALRGHPLKTLPTAHDRA